VLSAQKFQMSQATAKMDHELRLLQMEIESQERRDRMQQEFFRPNYVLQSPLFVFLSYVLIGVP
jgi:hypothetical protein